jgi:hypothetical protein
MLRELGLRLDPLFWNLSPIGVYEAMTLTDRYAYCPFAYGYSNYSRLGYARRLWKNGARLRFRGMATLCFQQVDGFVLQTMRRPGFTYQSIYMYRSNISSKTPPSKRSAPMFVTGMRRHAIADLRSASASGEE